MLPIDEDKSVSWLALIGYNAALFVSFIKYLLAQEYTPFSAAS